jgi:hypothetical protein
MSQIDRKGSTGWPAHGTRHTVMQNLVEQARIECEEHGPKNHASRAPKPRVPCVFQQALAMVLPGADHKAIEAFFLNQVRYPSIKHWRAGRRVAPAWARDLLAARLEQQAAELRAAASALRALKSAEPLSKIAA